jgi:hypothetical protein
MGLKFQTAVRSFGWMGPIPFDPRLHGSMRRYASGSGQSSLYLAGLFRLWGAYSEKSVRAYPRLSVRTYVWTNCGLILDRDENAARKVLWRGQRLRGLAGMPAGRNREPVGLEPRGVSDSATTHCPIRRLCLRSGPSAWRQWPCSSAASPLYWEPTGNGMVAAIQPPYSDAASAIMISASSGQPDTP